MTDRRAEEWVGRIVGGRYRILAPLGAGGMAQVFRAEQIASGTVVALKVHQCAALVPEQDPSMQRFTAEAETLARLREPHTVQVLDFGQEGPGLCYIAMELIEGQPLSELLREQGALGTARALRIAHQIGLSLRGAHALGVVHRDLKPSNIVMTQDGEGQDYVKVLDFGLAKDMNNPLDLTVTGTFFGAPAYVSPEQVTGTAQDQRMDIYALGVILYQMLSGRVPFDRPRALDTLLAHAEEPPPPLTIAGKPAPAPTSDLVMRCLAKAPSDRFPSVEELLKALERLKQESKTAPVPEVEDDTTRIMTAAEHVLQAEGPPPAPASPRVGWPWLTAALLAITLAAAALAYGAWWLALGK